MPCELTLVIHLFVQCVGGEWEYKRDIINYNIQITFIDTENFVQKYSIVQKLDHLTCTKCLSMTLLQNMYKPIIIHSGLFSELRQMSNGLPFEMHKFSGLLPND